ncbi:hypothetical protein [Kitasatospora sp. NPDC007106]|uniref:hypothetical protein n=1 Tax=Kitasatospora sp. NPDC007106 TaxID=3156914 RepID=UPI0033D24E58
MILRKVASGATALGLAAAGLALSAPDASAGAYGCAGGEIDTSPVKAGSTTFGTIHPYYDPSTGDNCAVNVATSAGGYGVDKYTAMTIIRCKQTPPTGTCSIDDVRVGAKEYKYYAGPVKLQAADHCINVVGRVDYNGSYASGGSVGGVHCG